MCQGYELVSKTKTRRFLKEYISGDISEEAVEFIQHLLEYQLKSICKECVIEQEKSNQRRKMCGLPPRKRFGVTSFKNVAVVQYKPLSDLLIGERANSELSCQVE